jgi:predicted transcriptional regulator
MTSDELLGAPLEELEFLARSPNRIRVLDALTRGPIGRDNIEEIAEVSRATLGRILDDFETRGWVWEVNRQYQTTQLGEYVFREISTILDRFAPVPGLNEVAQWFPEDGFGFDLENLAGSTIVQTTRNNALAPTTHIAKRIRNANNVRLITYSVLPGIMDECWRGTVEGNLELVSVLDRGAFDNIGSDPQMAELAREMAESGRSEVYMYFGNIPSTMFIVDDVVLLCLSGGEGAPLAVIETDDETVRSWAEDTIDDLRDEGERLEPSLFVV